MGWFSKKPAWEDDYAQNIYKAFVIDDELGEMTPEKLRVPPPAVRQFFDKMYAQREAMCFVALMSAARPETKLPPVMMSFSRLLQKTIEARGLQIDMDDFANAAVDDVREMFAEPFDWGQRWLADFRNDPNDNYMVVMFADHCQRLFNAYKHGIENAK